MGVAQGRRPRRARAQTPAGAWCGVAGVVLGLKGFAAAALGGIGSGPGALVGGLLLGVMESLAAGYLSAAYKDVVAFVLVLLVLMFMPRGLFGSKVTERV